MCFGTKIPNSSEGCCLKPDLYHSVTDIVETKNTLIQERHDHTKSFIAVKASRKMQKVEIHLTSDGSALAFFSTDLGHVFGSNVGNDFG